ncbi:MAG TPA: EF-hand domain-containing protein [Steroidobacteraceae bacterium]|nr:EF-hand domain-containing protein [Steroidobacteraceae bacterium]
MLRSLAVAFTAVAGIALSIAQAADAPTFDSLDKDHDGQLSLDEASANDQLFTAFKTLDKDKDGKLSKQEFAQYKAG